MVGFLYGQTEYSILENAIHLEDYVKHAVDNGFSFLTITDNNLAGFYKFYELCTKNNIKPIYGLKTKIESLCDKDNYVLLYAKNSIGFKNLMQISTIQATDGIVKDEDIKKHKEGLILVTSSLDSNLNEYLFDENEDLTTNEIERLISLTDDFYYGIMPSSFMFASIFEDIERVVAKYNLRVVPVAKCSYLNQEDEEVYQVLMKKKGIEISLGVDDLHLKTSEELEEEFSDYPEVFSNLEDLVNSVSSEVFPKTHELPKYKNKYGISSLEYLKSLCEKGLNKRINQDSITDKETYFARIKYELDVIDKMGFQDYFLLVFEFVSYAKKSGIFVGPGRGSGAGSLVCYSLGITDIDPIKNDLMFERFLNIERITMPDIDIDFPDDKRNLVAEHIVELYGADHVCLISTFDTFQLKSSINEIFALFGYNERYIAPTIAFLEKNPTDEQINKEFQTHPEILKAISIARRMEGLPSAQKTHAPGVLICDEKVADVLPLRPGQNGIMQAQIEAAELEKQHFLKMDLLSVRNLTLIDKMIREINKTDKLSFKDIPLDNDKAFEIFRKGETQNIFQFSGAEFTRYTKELGPTCFEDIAAMIALYRPGPKDSIPEYIKRKHTGKVNYLHEDLEPILKGTYGIITYQEQIIKIAQKFGGYSLGEADVLRRAISKKKLEVLEAERANFTKRASANGYSDKVANEIYDYIVKFADYGFNRNHSVAYAVVSYKMAYLKANYPEVFIATMLNEEMNNAPYVKEYIDYGLLHNVKFLQPDVNYSSFEFIVSSGKVLLPLCIVKSITSSLAKEIIDERTKGKFLSFSDFKKRMGDRIKTEELTNLINAGALDGLGSTHEYMLNNMSGSFESYMDADDMIVSNDELPINELSNKEYAALKFNFKYDFFDQLFKDYKATMPDDLVVGKTVNVVGIIRFRNRRKTKTGKVMCTLSIHSRGKYLDATVFEEAYLKYGEVLDSKRLVLLNGVVSSYKGNIQLEVIRMKRLEDKLEEESNDRLKY